MFNNEAEFEKALIDLLITQKGWQDVIKNPSEQDLINNWAKILFENNNTIDRLNDEPLTDGEMRQILAKINELKTPMYLNGFINGTSVIIKRDNLNDKEHYGKEVSLKIYDRDEIAKGQSRYQIVQQPKFPTANPMLNNRRGDIMLLINGMPVFHIELKRSDIPVSQAQNQIEKYAREKIFTGLFALVQVFVAMTPEDATYFANPGPDGKFNPQFYFRWTDFYNNIIKGWKDFASAFLNIPMAHQIIGFYTVADTQQGVLKVLRSYQYYAAHAISDKVSKSTWSGKNHQLGGHIWHTTGSGKTLTSFKAAQLIASSKDADKVVFLVDRIELGTQSLEEYRAFKNDDESVQATENTDVLISTLKSDNPADTLIVTSIQKMSNIKEDGKLQAADIEKMQKKRIVVIVDEAHRSTFGDMLIDVKNTFPEAIFFGFTGTPIQEENKIKGCTTTSVFGDELHRYSIYHGIRDKSVLGFDPYLVETFKSKDLRKAVALHEAKADTEEEAFADDIKKKMYLHFINDVEMAGHENENGAYIKGIEDYIPESQYNNDDEKPEHRIKVVEDIIDNWLTLSRNSKFHAIFATSSIPEAIAYYRLIKAEKPSLKITSLFDPHIGNDNPDGAGYKEDGLAEILTDYNTRYDMHFTIPSHADFKKDLSARLAHKKPYQNIANTPNEQIDLLIVVNQMLTGFDSKWINTLYIDKEMEYANIIQAFSRTNRLFGEDKPFGTIRYYRRPHTMQKNIEKAVKLYSGEGPFELFVDKIDENIRAMNRIFADINDLFASAEISHFEKLPKEVADRKKFSQQFKELSLHLQAAQIQGFRWDFQPGEHSTDDSFNDIEQKVQIDFDENTYLTLAQRYKELFKPNPLDPPSTEGFVTPPYDIDGYLTEIDTSKIDIDYMNAHFEIYMNIINTKDATDEAKEKALKDLHTSFSMLSVEDQKYAGIFLREIQSGKVTVEKGKTFRDYITQYKTTVKDDQIQMMAKKFGLDEEMLRDIMKLQITETNIDEFNRFTNLIDTRDKQKSKAYFDKKENTDVLMKDVNMKLDELLRNFILQGGFEI